MSKQFLIQMSLSLFVCGLLSGCLSTRLETEPLPPEIFTLAAGSIRPVQLSVALNPESPLNDSPTVGHQYLFVIIPFGTVSAKTAARDVERSLYTHLALRNFKPLVNTPEVRAEQPILKVSIVDLQATAYDFFFFRRIICKIALKGELILGNSLRRMALVTGNGSANKRFGFKEQLDHYFAHALSDASEQLLNELGLG